MKPDSFTLAYSSKSDYELLALAAERDSLVEEARRVLNIELRRRNLEGPLPVSAGPTVAGPESHAGIKGPLQLASGVAVFLVSAFWSLAIFGAFVHANRYGLLTVRNSSLLAGLFSLITVLSFVGAFLLILGAIKSKQPAS